VFDKTGTLTEGRPTVTDEVLLENVVELVGENWPQATPNSTNGQVNNRYINSSSHPSVSSSGKLSTSNAVEDMSPEEEQQAKDKLIQLAATAEQQSNHPLARAIISQCVDTRKLPLGALSKISPENEKNSKSSAGNGVTCEGPQGVLIRVGNRAYMYNNNVTLSPRVNENLWNVEVQGKTAVCVAVNSTIVGIIGIADVAKPEAYGAIKALRAMNIDVWMLTGDNRTTAEILADELEIPKDRVMAGVLPIDKRAKIEELQRAGQVVAMVGDGINDSPALAQADLGIAIGAGTQVAIEAADMVLIRSNLHDLVVALDLATKVFARVKWNFMWAFIYNAISVPFAAGALYPWTKMLMPPQYAGLAMAMSSVSVVLSSMSLKFYRRPDTLKDDDVHKGGILEKASRTLTSLKESVSGGSSSNGGGISSTSNGIQQYKPLPLDEGELDQDGMKLGLELGIGSFGGLKGSRGYVGDHDNGVV